MNNIYDQFFLQHTFNSNALKAAAEKEIEWLIRHLKNLNKESKILDVACGSGRHLLALVNQGFSPLGIDNSPDCVELAKKNCAKIANNIIEIDFKTFAKSNALYFDLILIVGGSFGYEQTLKRSLEYIKNSFEMLQKDGNIEIQFVNKNWSKLKFSKSTTFWSESDEYFILDKRLIRDDKLLSDKIYVEKSSGGIRRYSDSIFIFSEEEIVSFIRGSISGGSEIKLHDGFNESKFNNLTSATPILTIRK